MKRIGKAAIELLVSLGYPALLALLALSLSVFTAQPNLDGSPAVSDSAAIVFSVIAIASFIGIIFYGVWDWDREPIAGFLYRLMYCALRIVVTPILFTPFFVVWIFVLDVINLLFKLI